MTPTGLDHFPETHTHPETGQEPGAKLNREDARQGQNIRGMIVVLVAGILLVSASYGVMLALQATPASATEDSRRAAVAATSDSIPTSPGEAAPPVAPPAN
jgi:hypothetical protein